jgi:tetratricopeptide (TPR) repeat protein
VRRFWGAFCCVFLLAVGVTSALAETAGTQTAASALAERAFARGVPVPAWVDPIHDLPAPVPNGPLSIRLADLQFRVHREMETYQHRAITVHESSSLGALGQFDIEFQPDYQHVQLHKLAILRGGEVIDKLTSADIRFLQRETALEQGIFTGSVTAEIITTDVRVGDTLEVEYTVVGENPVFGHHFMQSAQWDYPVPVALRRVIVDAPEDLKIDYRLMGDGTGPQPQQSEQHRNGRKSMRFEARNIPAVVSEAYVPSDVYQLRWLQFSDFRSWADVNAWALELFSGAASDKALAAPLRAARAARSQEEMVAKVLEFVQNDIRYLSISLGANSHRPFPPEQVLERRYGDCKDKSLLTVTMLRRLGIQADPVLVPTYITKGVDRLLPSPILFDHAIVRAVVGGKDYYIDPTRLGQYGPLERMGQVHGGRQVLVVAPSTTGLSTIPEAGGDLILGKRSERIVVTAFDKPAEMIEIIETSAVGAEAARVQLARMSKEELRKAYEGSLVKRYPDSQLVGDPVIRDDRQRNVLSIEIHHRINDLFTPTADGWSMNYTPSNLTERFAPPGNAHRSYPLIVPDFPRAHSYDLEVVLPDSFNMTENRYLRSIDDPAFKLERVLEVRKRSLHVNISMVMLADRVTPSQLPRYMKDIQTLNEITGGSLRVYKADMGDARRTAASGRQTEEERLNQSLQRISRVIADADAIGRDASAALCERALVHAYLGHQAEALKDANRAVQQQPNDALRCRADVNFALGRFKESEADYAKAIARGDDSASAYQGHGLAALYLNKLALAQTEFSLAASKAVDAAERTRADILRLIAGGKPTIEKDSTEPDLAWLRAARAMFTGSGDPEHMVGLAMRGNSIDVDARIVEAYYYAGHYWLLHENRLKARACFQRALDKRILNSTYHIAVRSELARMGT